MARIKRANPKQQRLQIIYLRKNQVKKRLKFESLFIFLKPA